MGLFTFTRALIPGKDNAILEIRSEFDSIISHCLGDIKQNGYLRLYGGPKCGKTTLLNQIYYQFDNDKEYNVFPVMVDFNGLSLGQNPFHYMAIAMDIKPKAAIERPNSFISTIQNKLKYLRKRQSVFLLENLDAIPLDSRRIFANHLRYIFEQTDTSFMTFILCGGLELFNLSSKEMSPLKNVSFPMYLSDFSNKTVRNIFSKGLEKIGIPIINSESCIDMITDLTCGQPYLTQKACSFIEVHPEYCNKQSINREEISNFLLANDLFVRSLQRRLRTNLLLDTCERICKGTDPISSNKRDDEIEKLLILGIIREGELHWEVRNPIFKAAIIDNSSSVTAKKQSPIRILHLSDLHFTKEINPESQIIALKQDLQYGEHLEFGEDCTLDAIVITGDLTDKSSINGFKNAYKFIKKAIKEFHIPPNNCIIAPGNHDVVYSSRDYKVAPSANGLSTGEYTVQGDTILARSKTYTKRFNAFSKYIFRPIMKKDYPLDFSLQGMDYFCPNIGIQFLALNSAWQIDKYNPKRKGINPEAIANVISKADRQIKKSRNNVLRIALWHHSVSGPEMMPDIAFLELLQLANVHICLHGDVHEGIRNHLGYWHKNGTGGIQVIGAGSFGASSINRPESTPYIYNIIEIFRNNKMQKKPLIRVHTRRRRKLGGKWEGYYEWDGPCAAGCRIPYYDF